MTVVLGTEHRLVSAHKRAGRATGAYVQNWDLFGLPKESDRTTNKKKGKLALVGSTHKIINLATNPAYRISFFASSLSSLFIDAEAFNVFLIRKGGH